jgi:DNA-binding transcriptional regulator YhcF (GntR family)/DNA-binding LacI/PurR family transcriptional regulator
MPKAEIGVTAPSVNKYDIIFKYHTLWLLKKNGCNFDSKRTLRNHIKYLCYSVAVSSHQRIPKKNKEAKYRVITSHLRNLINKGELQPGTQLPTAHVMAKEWETNYFTIQLALKPLVNEGLIERRQRRGTFVRDRNTQVASAAIYFGGNLWCSDQVFYQSMYQYLSAFYQERRGRSVLFVDDRPDQKRFVPLPELQKAIDQREVQGVLGLMLSSSEVGWLRKLQVPISLFGSAGMHSDTMELFETVLARFAADGCRTVGMVCPRLGRDVSAIFKNLVKRHGMETHPDWIRGTDWSELALEFSGYRLFKDLWSSPSHPEGIFVYPDMACRGAVVAALELGLRIPRDVRLIFHRNTGIDYLCPWKIPVVVTDVKEVSHLLATHLDAQYRHDSTLPPHMGFKTIDCLEMIG